MAMKSLPTARGNPYITIIWLLIIGSGILFLFLIIAYLIRVNNLSGKHIVIPGYFYLSTVFIFASSLTLHQANKCFRKELFKAYFSWIGITVLAAVAFCIFQILGWQNLFNQGVNFKNIEGAFIYILSGLHFSHMAFGLTGLALVLRDSFKNRRYVDGFIVSLNPAKNTLAQIVTIFWHFLGFLWIALFCVFLIH